MSKNQAKSGVSVAAQQQAPKYSVATSTFCHFYKKETKPFFPRKKYLNQLVT